MQESSNKIIYIIGGIILVIITIPVVIMILGFLGGLFYYMNGTTN